MGQVVQDGFGLDRGDDGPDGAAEGAEPQGIGDPATILISRPGERSECSAGTERGLALSISHNGRAIV